MSQSADGHQAEEDTEDTDEEEGGVGDWNLSENLLDRIEALPHGLIFIYSFS
jgi:hypothetical protein